MLLTDNFQKGFNINENRKVKINNLIKNNAEITIYIDEFNLDGFQEINVVLRNIKTRDEYKCNFSVNKNTLVINLESLGGYFTDYEGDLYITLIKENNCTCITPLIIKKIIYNNKIDLEKHEFHWYIRALENGEIRLSSIKKLR